ncbi:hypothetical protein MTR67_051080 [Solanum verrucosum]|uniref:PPM-type phosphatase domain-containing protein n=1 Tax=Solanum verrucosum TaxID=315347 RepID=A0AAF1A237_SOLVR|nr:hypothetical protein MTR67_051080 [Solanum verrucosum]
MKEIKCVMPRTTGELLKFWNNMGGTVGQKTWWNAIASSIWWTIGTIFLKHERDQMRHANGYWRTIKILEQHGRDCEAEDMVECNCFNEEENGAVLVFFLLEFKKIVYAQMVRQATLHRTPKGANSDYRGPSAGSTACVAIIQNVQLLVANAGDSRCILSRKGQASLATNQEKYETIWRGIVMPDFLPGPCLDAVLRCQQALARFHRKRPLSDLSIHWNPVSDYLSREMLMSNTSVMAFQVLDPKTPLLSVLGNFIPLDKTKGVVSIKETIDKGTVVLRTKNVMQAYDMSRDHKPDLQPEKERIRNAGGYVRCGRVNGTLNMSRAIGDMELKQNKSLPAEKQIVTANPDICTVELCNDDDFLVLACDGIWDCMSSQEVVDFVGKQLKHEKRLSTVCETVMDKCLAPATGGEGCDNMTMILVQFKKPSTISTVIKEQPLASNQYSECNGSTVTSNDMP